MQEGDFFFKKSRGDLSIRQGKKGVLDTNVAGRDRQMMICVEAGAI